MTQRVLTTLGLVALLAGCGDDSGSSTAAASTTTAAPAVAPEGVAPQPSAGCGSSTVAAGETEQTVRSRGRDRSYFRHVPPAHDGSTPLPLVVDYHGYSEGAAVHTHFSALGPFGDEHGFVTLTPDSGYPVPTWDMDLEGDDVALFGDLLDQAGGDLCLDLNRVYVTGLSYGAFQTSALGCAYSDRIAAIAPIAGFQEVEGCELERPVPVVAFHGTEDQFISYEGGYGPAVAGLPTPDGSGDTLGDLPESIGDDVPSEPEVAAIWAERDGCATEPTEDRVADDVTLISFECPAGVDVELYRIEGGGHTWPGSEFGRSVEDVVGHTTFSIDANQVMWDFFQDHPLA